MSEDYVFVAKNGACVNANWWYLHSGAAYNYTKKLEVAMAFN